MKKNIFHICLCLFIFSCTRDLDDPRQNLVPVTTPFAETTQFTVYTIRKGQNFSDSNNFIQVQYADLKFIAKFDSSAIYQTVNPNNQYDINKLYGFSDNNAQHHQFSARFGWRWSDNALRLFGYIYNNGAVQHKELGTVVIGSENNCSIKVTAKSYIFSLNKVVDSLPRASITPLGSGYKLYPYFGGDEPAPHDVIIRIKEL